MSVSSVSHVCQVNLLTIWSDDELRPWPFIGTVGNQLFHIIQILWSDVLRSSEVRRDKFRNTELVKLKDWIWCDD